MGNYVGNAGEFLVDTLVGLYILAVMLRFLLQWVRADFYNPISQGLVTITNPPLKILRGLIPGLWGIDLASIALMLVLAIAKVYVIFMMHGAMPQLPGALIFAVGELLQLAVYVFIFAIFIRVILSWVSPGGYNPAVSLLISLTEPLMAPARRLLPAMGGLDLSPIFVLLFLELTRRLLVQPLLDYGRALF